jgi:NitT/TauT family transport system permease protein
MLGMLGISSGFGQPLHHGWPRADESGGPPQAVLIKAGGVSAVRLIEGFVASILAGSILGMFMWRYEIINDFLGPLFLGLQTLPSVCWIPLAVIFFGLQEGGILFVLIMGSAFGIAISLRDGLRTIPPLYQRAGLMLGARKWRLYRYVLLPAAMPAISSSLRQGFSFAWRSLMGAELVLMADKRGIGFLLFNGENNSDIAQVVAVMIVMVVIGMVADRLVFAPLERRVQVRFGLGRG